MKEIKIDVKDIKSLGVIDCKIGDELIFSDGNQFSVVGDGCVVSACYNCDLMWHEYRMCGKVPCLSGGFHVEKIIT